MVMDMILPRRDKRVISVSSIEDAQIEFFLQRSAVERMNAIELNRRMVYGRDRVASRLQRFLEIA